MKFFRTMSIVFIMLFAVLLSIRMGMFKAENKAENTKSASMLLAASERDTWMNIFQSGNKIGYSHSVFSKKENEYHLKEAVFMRINTLGMIQDIHMNTKGVLNPDFTLSSFDFEIRSGLFDFAAKGTVSEDTLSIETRSSDVSRTFDIKISKKPYLVSGIMDAITSAGVKTGDTLSFDIFDPTSMSEETVEVHVIAKEDLTIEDVERTATKISLNFKGSTQFAWISEDGEVLKEEGLLGITMEKTTPEDAVFGIAIKSSEDLTKIAAVPSDVPIENPAQLNLLKLEVSGISLNEGAGLQLNQGRQSLEGNILTIHKESLTDIPDSQPTANSQQPTAEFLKSTPFIQSDHEKIRNLAESIVSDNDTALEKARKLMDWIHNNIEKRPVLSVPDAISTLENRMGDCNEHAALLAALARASDIPAKIEAGLVYMNGSFYYHAWNLLYVGKWITADAVMGQIPADVTHICFATGEQEQQLNIMGIIGKIKLKVK